MLIEDATEEVHAARRQYHLEVVERTRLRRFIERVDAVIAACEETHLQGIKEVSPELRSQADKAFAFGRKAVRLTGDEFSSKVVDETLARRQIKITEVMDALWAMQEIVFDLMLPWRTELPEDVEDSELTANDSEWREFYSAA